MARRAHPGVERNRRRLQQGRQVMGDKSQKEKDKNRKQKAAKNADTVKRKKEKQEKTSAAGPMK